MAVGMGNIERIAETIQTDSNARHISVGDCKNRFADRHTRAHIDSPVKMMRARLTKIARQCDFVIDGRRELQRCC